MIERADQLVLDYLSKVAELSHKVLTPEERLDFVKRLRARIDELRGGSEGIQDARKAIERFGEPLALVTREAEKLRAAQKVPEALEPPPTEDDLDTQVIATPPQAARLRLPGQGLPGSGLPGTQWVPPQMGRETPGVVQALQAVQATVGRDQNAPNGGSGPARPPTDARTLIDTHRNGLFAMAILLLAGILAPMPLPLVAIFPVWLIMWAGGAAATLAYGGWLFKDRLIGVLTPLAVLLLGALAVGLVDASQTSLMDLRAYTQAFSDVGPVMFIIGTALGVAYLLLKLIRPAKPARAEFWPRRW